MIHEIRELPMKHYNVVPIFSFFFLTFSLNIAVAQIPLDRDGLLNAEGMGQAKYAEMNGYPGPKHVLDLANELVLTPDQAKSIKVIFKEMETRSKELGVHIIRIEEELNDAFKEGMLNEKSVRDDTEQIGKLRGRLRATHLVAHLKTKEILTPKQIDLYVKLRNTDAKKK